MNVSYSRVEGVSAAAGPKGGSPPLNHQGDAPTGREGGRHASGGGHPSAREGTLQENAHARA